MGQRAFPFTIAIVKHTVAAGVRWLLFAGQSGVDLYCDVLLHGCRFVLFQFFPVLIVAFRLFLIFWGRRLL
jgi:hypothetical protein